MRRALASALLSLLLAGALGAAVSPSAEVLLDGGALFAVQAPSGSFSPQERADAISRRLEGLKAGDLGALRLRTVDGGVQGLAGEQLLFLVSPADAKAAGGKPEALAGAWLEAIRAGLQRWDAVHHWRHWARQAAFAALTLLLFLLCAWLLQRGFLALASWIRARRARFPALRLRRLEIVGGGQVADLVLGAIRLLRNALGLVLLYFMLTGLLGSFDSTRHLSQDLLFTLGRPISQAWSTFVDYIPNLIRIGVGVLLVYYAIQVLQFLFHHLHLGSIDLPGFERDWAQPTYKIVRFMVIVLGVIVLAPYLPGARSPAFQGVSLFLGVIISLSSSSALANIIAGVILIYTSAFKVGDRVRIGDSQGVVLERTLLVTRLRSTKNVVVTLPNAMVLSGKVENESSRPGREPRILPTSVTIGYEVPWPQVHRLLLGALDGVEGALTEPKPFVLQTSLDDFYVTYQLNFSTDRPESQEQVLSAVHAKIQSAFAAADVEILSPHYRAERPGPKAVPMGLDRKDS